MKLTPEQLKALDEELKGLDAERLKRFQQHLIDNNHIMSDEFAQELLEIVEDFLDKEGQLI